jgi:hypothetical protein
MTARVQPSSDVTASFNQIRIAVDERFFALAFMAEMID